MTNMVFEFTDTQGVMGMHYARHDGEAEDVAVALNEQYQPRFAGDDLPSNPVACAWRLPIRWTPWRVSSVSASTRKAIKTRLRCVARAGRAAYHR
jgi:glycyl-tRNA synthetase beta chain